MNFTGCLFHLIRSEEITRNINDRVTSVTNEMRVRLCVAVEVLLSVEDADAQNGSIFPKLRQVPVDRAEGKIRIHRFELLVNPLCGRVARCGPNRLQYGFTFSAVVPFFLRWLHCIPPFIF